MATISNAGDKYLCKILLKTGEIVLQKFQVLFETKSMSWSSSPAELTLLKNCSISSKAMLTQCSLAMGKYLFKVKTKCTATTSTCIVLVAFLLTLKKYLPNKFYLITKVLRQCSLLFSIGDIIFVDVTI